MSSPLHRRSLHLAAGVEGGVLTAFPGSPAGPGFPWKQDPDLKQLQENIRNMISFASGEAKTAPDCHMMKAWVCFWGVDGGRKGETLDGLTRLGNA